MTHTHNLIKSKTLRSAYASELWQARIMRKIYTPEEWSIFRYGLESGVWTVQKMLVRDVLQ